MADPKQQWKMVNIQFGFVVFEKSYNCEGIRTYFTTEDFPILGDEYREGDCFWSIVENAQTFQFNLQNTTSGQMVSYKDLMGIMYCTSCREDCEVEIMQQKLAAEKTWIMVAFGHLPDAKENPIAQEKLDILTAYFNQRRDTSRSRIKIINFNIIEDLSRCHGDFLHDVGMLSMEEPGERRSLFG